MYCFESNNLIRISIFHNELNLSGKTQANEVGLQAAEDQKRIRISSAWINHTGTVDMKCF